MLISAPPPSSLVIARAPDVTSIDSAALLKQLTARFGGKGGGRPELAQGGGLTGNVAEIVDAARALLR
jgi:alanyl-tRNA synthetase